MPKSRIILLVLLAVAAILAIQNWSGAISLMFLGMKTAPLPLSAWILLGVAAGALTSGLISILFVFQAGSAQAAGRPRPRPPDTPPPERDRDKNKTNQSGRSDRSPPIEERQKEQRQQEQRQQEYLQDREYKQGEEFADEPRDRIPNSTNYANYDEEPWDDEEDWLPETEERFSPESAREQNFPNQRTVYEIPQEPIGEIHSGSMYSYTYKNKENANSQKNEKQSNYDDSNLEEGTTEYRDKEIDIDTDDFFEEDILESIEDDSEPSEREPRTELEYDRVRDSEPAARDAIQDARDSEPAARDTVQDANYRVIEPPAQPLDPNGKQAAANKGDDDWEKRQYNNDDDW